VIPGKTYKPEDFAEAAWRRRWLIVLPFVAIAAGSVVVSQLLPNRYESMALLMIVPQRVPEDYVKATVTERIDERRQSIQQEIMSRTQLEHIIQEFDLYASERKRMIMEDVVEMMRKEDIKIGLPKNRREGGSFTVAFLSSDPRTAMRVAEQLSSLFIRANLENRTVLADMTDQFLQSQLEDARRQLQEHERKLEAFRQANPGQMPAQFEANQQALQGAQMQWQALQESINRDRDRLLMVQRQVAEMAAAAANNPPRAEAAAAGAPMTAARALEIARAGLRNMEMRLTAEHPDIRAAKRTIRELEQKAAAEALQQPVSPATEGPSPAEAATASRWTELQAERETLERRIAQKHEEEKRLMASMAGFAHRLDAAPGVESRLTELMRDYTTLQVTYQSLLTKSQEAKVAANLERRQIGEQFKVIDSPRMPQRPVSPNRLRLNLLGALAGLAVGFGLAALLEYRDKSLRSEEDVLLALALPVIALVPTMRTSFERQQFKRRRVLVASSCALMVVLALVVLVWRFRLVEDWIR